MEIVSVYFKVLSLDKVSSRQIWNIEQKKKQSKRESGRQASEAQQAKARHGFRARDKNQRRHFFVGGTT